LPSMSHVSARQEYRNLVEALNLPSSEKADARRAALAAWSDGGAVPEFEHMAPVP
jgi:chromosome partitioning protein